MPRRRLVPVRVPAAALLLLTAGLTGCAGGAVVAPSGSAQTATLATGPGPQARYTVHRAPAPGACRYRDVGGKPLPDPACTPGAVNPQVTQQTLRTTICRKGYTAKIRPPRQVTDAEKRLSARAYGYTGSFATAQLDHLVPLAVGGDPNDPRNLWLQPNDDPAATTNANSKDVVGEVLQRAVCDGRVKLAEAQRAIALNWVTALSVLGLDPSQ